MKRFNRGRRSNKRDGRNSGLPEGNVQNSDPQSFSFNQRQMPERAKKSVERLRWTAPKPLNIPLPALQCIRCGQSIVDPHTALADKTSGDPVHFDCVLSELLEKETLEQGDTLSYIGGGRFGILQFNSRKGELKYFTIKKIMEWEDKENRAKWRYAFADHYSLT